MLGVFRGSSKWGWLRLLLEALRLDDPRLQEAAAADLRAWLPRSNSTYVPLGEEEREALLVRLAEVRRQVDDSLVAQVEFALRSAK